MRRGKKIGSMILASCMMMSLVVTNPTDFVYAAEALNPTEIAYAAEPANVEEMVSIVESAYEEESEPATNTDAEIAEPADTNGTERDWLDGETPEEEQYSDEMLMETEHYREDVHEMLEEDTQYISATGEADAAGFVWDGTTLVKYKGKGGNVTIPDKCTTIATGAFFNDETITGITIPASVTEIEHQAFYRVPNLDTIVVDPKNSVYNSNGDCNAIILTEYNELVVGSNKTTIPEGVEIIGTYAFKARQGFKNLVLPSSVSSIDPWAFDDCPLETITVSKENTTYTSGYGWNAVINRTTKELVVGSANTKMAKAVLSIGRNAFYGRTGLTSITFQPTLQRIDGYAFANCTGLKEITIPAGVEKVGTDAFMGCQLEKLVVEADNPVYTSGDNANAIIEKSTNKLIIGCGTTKIPDTVVQIADWAFEKCKNLTSIHIPASVEKIGGGIFSCCPLETITVDENNPVFTDGGTKGAIIEKETGRLVRLAYNTDIPKGIKRIGPFAIDGYKKTKVIKLPDTVIAVEYRGFWNSPDIIEIQYPRCTTTFESGALSDCSPDVLMAVYEGSSCHILMSFVWSNFRFLQELPAVTGISAVPAGKNKVKITWDKVSDAKGYLIYAQKDKKYGYVGMTSSTTFTDTKALDYDYNYYFVFAYTKDPYDEMVVGASPKYVYAKGVCTAVTDLRASSLVGGVKLTWSKVPDAEGYLIYGMENGGKYHYIGMTKSSLATNTFTDKKASKTEYNFYWVFPYHYDKNGNMAVGRVCTKYTYGKAR